MAYSDKFTISLLKLLNEELKAEGKQVVIIDKDDMSSNNFGALVRQLRKNKKIRQTDLAKAAGVAPNTLIGIELGTRNPSEEVMQKIAEALEADIFYTLKQKKQ